MHGNSRQDRRLAENLFAIEIWKQSDAEDNSIRMQRLKRNLCRAMENELTPRQRVFMTMFYFEGMSMTQIASETGVNVSTVSRAIKRGKYRLEKCLKYSF